MAQPEIDVQEVPESAKDETKLKFVATVERRPDIELPEIDGMEIEVAKAEITDEDINNRLEALRQRFGTLVGVDRPAAKGDYASIDLTAEIDGEVVDSQEGVSYELGSETMLRLSKACPPAKRPPSKVPWKQASTKARRLRSRSRSTPSRLKSCRNSTTTSLLKPLSSTPSTS